MSTAPTWERRFWRFLDVQLSPFPGRGNALLRNVLACALVIILSMSLEVPLLALSLIIVFFVSQSNLMLTRMVGILFMVSATIAVGIAILLLKFTYGYPLLRILCASVVFLISMFAMRATRLGPLFFVVAIVTIYVQSLVDLNTQPELLLRACLWVWMAVVYPILVTLLVNTLLLPKEPQRQLRETMRRQLAQVEIRLAALGEGHPDTTRIGAVEVQQGLLSLHKLLKYASMRGSVKGSREIDQLALITCVSRLYAAAAALVSKGNDTEALAALRQDCAALAAAIDNDTLLQPRVLHSGALQRLLVPPALEEMRDALRALAVTDHATPSSAPTTKEPLLVRDAFSNPNYLLFAFKTWLATLICYVFYTGVDWPGIHTVMLTCVIVALPSLGASTQKGLLRIGGCLVGSALTLLCIVFVVPHIETLVGLLAMSLPVIALGAWVAAGSERISYAGLQIMFCFALALLEQFGPSIDLTEIRDRLVGILLGVLVSTLVHGVLWPESEGDGLRRRLAEVLHGIAALLRSPALEPGETSDRLHGQSLRSWSQLAECEAMLARVALEPGWHQGEHEELTLFTQTLLAKSREILLLTGQLQRNRIALDAQLRAPTQRWLDERQQQMGDWLERYAVHLQTRGTELEVLPALGIMMTGGDANAEALAHDLRTLHHLLDLLPEWQHVEQGALPEPSP
ncbi:FUSC family protein [Pseudomonas sp. GM48]|uniref:FUSC family protein n=1 Tax=Pseudomonas sp. GM48 TaxID=1144330 RepID=UPI00027052F1|nr:FUSC family protein [Pseudomonas sp. GM48]EJM51668.1 putative membrane protein [Pseudomonas sp. GM48]